VQAHANDLRAEVEKDWRTLIRRTVEAQPTGGELDAFVHQVVRDWRGAPLVPRIATLLAHAEQVTRAPSTCVAADIRTLRESGWSDQAIHDAVQVVGYFNYINRVADALGVEPERGMPTWGQAGFDSACASG